MTVFGFASGEFQYADSSVFTHWADRDDYPVSARNYAHEVFAYSDDLEETPENIQDELDDWFGKGEWQLATDDGSVIEAFDTTSAWPFIVRRRIVLVLKYHDGVNGWSEKPYNLRMAIDELMEPAVTPKVWIDCD